MTEDQKLLGLVAWGAPMAIGYMAGVGPAVQGFIAFVSLAAPAITGTTMGLVAAAQYMSRKGPALILGPMKK